MIGKIGFKPKNKELNQKDYDFINNLKTKDKPNKKETQRAENLQKRAKGQKAVKPFFKNAKGKFQKIDDFINENGYELPKNLFENLVNELGKSKGAKKDAGENDKKDFEKQLELLDKTAKNDIINSFFLDAYKLDQMQSRTFRLNGRFCTKENFCNFFLDLDLPPHYFFYVTVYTKKNITSLRIKINDLIAFDDAAKEAYNDDKGYYLDEFGNKIMFSS